MGYVYACVFWPSCRACIARMSSLLCELGRGLFLRRVRPSHAKSSLPVIALFLVVLIFISISIASEPSKPNELSGFRLVLFVLLAQFFVVFVVFLINSTARQPAPEELVSSALVACYLLFTSENVSVANLPWWFAVPLLFPSIYWISKSLRASLHGHPSAAGVKAETYLWMLVGIVVAFTVVEQPGANERFETGFFIALGILAATEFIGTFAQQTAPTGQALVLKRPFLQTWGICGVVLACLLVSLKLEPIHSEWLAIGLLAIVNSRTLARE